MIKFNGFPFLEKEDKEGHDAEFIEPSEPVKLLVSSSREAQEELIVHSTSLEDDEARHRHHEIDRHATSRDRCVFDLKVPPLSPLAPQTYFIHLRGHSSDNYGPGLPGRAERGRCDGPRLHP